MRAMWLRWSACPIFGGCHKDGGRAQQAVRSTLENGKKDCRDGGVPTPPCDASGKFRLGGERRADSGGETRVRVDTGSRSEFAGRDDCERGCTLVGLYRAPYRANNTYPGETYTRSLAQRGHAHRNAVAAFVAAAEMLTAFCALLRAGSSTLAVDSVNRGKLRQNGPASMW